MKLFEKHGQPSYQLVAGDGSNPDLVDDPFQTSRLTTSIYPRVNLSLSFLHKYAICILLFVCLLEAGTIAFLATTYLEGAPAWPASPIPRIPYISYNFTRTASMINLTSVDQVETAWGDYETTAFVHVPEPELYSLQPNKNVLAGTSNIYMLSVHHQLHCLKQLHLANVRSPGQSGQHEYRGEPESLKHLEHCFDYLRQAIVCAADGTLESPDLRKRSLSGYGTVHRCRKWDGLNGLDTWRLLNSPLQE